jgi:hypothetical protein
MIKRQTGRGGFGRAKSVGRYPGFIGVSASAAADSSDHHPSWVGEILDPGYPILGDWARERDFAL